MAATERTAGKPPPSHPRPLPPTPAAPKAAAVAKEVLKKPAAPRYSSVYDIASRKSCDLTWPTTPNELTERVSEWVLKASSKLDEKEKYITNARELLDEILVQTLLYQDTELQQLWMSTIELGYDNINSFTKLHRMETSDARFVDLCKRIKDHLKLQEQGKEELENIELKDRSELRDPPPKSTSWKTLKKIYLIATTILSLVGLFFTTRICIQRFLIKS